LGLALKVLPFLGALVIMQRLAPRPEVALFEKSEFLSNPSFLAYALIAIASSLPDKAICKPQLGTTIKAMVSNKSWQVQYMIANHFVKLAKSAGKDVWEELVGAYVHLLKDKEAEVRTAAAGQIPGP
jgi:hypothetical protein